MAQRVGILVNPAAGRGRARRLLARMQGSGAAEEYDIQMTVGPGDERRATLAALDRGCTTLVAIGGDGTWSQVAGALVESRADCRLALVAAGTGNDFAKSAGAPAHDLESTLRLAAEGADIAVDVIRIGGGICLNVAGFGFDAAVLADTAGIPILRGDALYLAAAARQLFQYQGLEIDTGSGFRRHLLLAICNGRHFGGQFHIAPHARLDDGLLEIIAIHDATSWQRIRLFASVIQGAHLGLSGVSSQSVTQMTLRFRQPPAYEIDGELRRAAGAELSIEVLPRVLRVVTSSPSTSAFPPGQAAP